MEKVKSEELIQLCQNGDEDAFEKLYKEYYPTAYRLAYHIAKSEADARDVAQETMLAVYQNINQLLHPEYFTLWMKRIVVAKCNRIFRKDTHIVYTDQDTEWMRERVDETSHYNPRFQMRFRNDQELMSFFIALLPEEQACVMNLFYFEQLSIKEIAKYLDIAQGTVKSRIFSAKKKLREYILGYQRREEIALDFKSDAFMAMLATKSVLSSSSISSFFSKSAILSSSITKIALLSVLCLVGGAGAFNVYREYQVNKKESSKEQLSDKYMNSSIVTQSFKSVQVQGVNIQSAQDAYFKLMLWADSVQQMEEKDKSEFSEMNRLLNSLRDFGGKYYDILEETGWVSAFNEFR